jgi:hypothetical protein
VTTVEAAMAAGVMAYMSRVPGPCGIVASTRTLRPELPQMMVRMLVRRHTPLAT